jgi:hypothetical protein
MLFISFSSSTITSVYSQLLFVSNISNQCDAMQVVPASPRSFNIDTLRYLAFRCPTNVVVFVNVRAHCFRRCFCFCRNLLKTFGDAERKY